LPTLRNRLRDLFDLHARPEIIVRHLGRDKIFGPSVKANPGLRVPGPFNGFELALRVVLGQQVTVKSATTIAGRLAAGRMLSRKRISLGATISEALPPNTRKRCPRPGDLHTLSLGYSE
jgi:AlkA N-terminal domain